MIVGGGAIRDFADHPRQKVWIERLGVHSTAAGAYQFLARTWDECRDALGLTDFSPGSQDLAMVFLTRRRGALDDVIAGRLESAIAKCALEWASLPGDAHGQGGINMDRARRVFVAWGGTIDDTGSAAPANKQTEPAAPAPGMPLNEGQDWPAQQEPTTMAPIIPALIGPLVSGLAEVIPRVASAWGKRSAVAERNVALGTALLEVATKVTGAANAQAAVEQVRADPAVRAKVSAAVDSWCELVEAGGSGIDGARRADAAAAARGDMLHSPSFWVTVLLIPLVYLVVGSVVGLWGKEWPSDVRAAIATAVVSLIVGGAAGYYWGQTTSRNRTPPAAS
jgi:hypothetical protein